MMACQLKHNSSDFMVSRKASERSLPAFLEVLLVLSFTWATLPISDRVPKLGIHLLMAAFTCKQHRCDPLIYYSKMDGSNLPFLQNLFLVRHSRLCPVLGESSHNRSDCILYLPYD